MEAEKNSNATNPALHGGGQIIVSLKYVPIMTIRLM